MHLGTLQAVGAPVPDPGPDPDPVLVPVAAEFVGRLKERGTDERGLLDLESL